MRTTPSSLSSGSLRLRALLHDLLLRLRSRPLPAADRSASGGSRPGGQGDGQPDQRRRLVAALEGGEIRPWFQPQINSLTGEISGAEALVRWQDPQRGLLLPGAFLDAVERHELGERLSRLVLRQALEALARWEAEGLEMPVIAVNFTGSDLRAPDLARHIRRELDHFGLSPRRLVIEVLETVCAMGEEDQLINNLTRLEAMGCGIDLDDFGTGYASFASLRRLPVHRLKIDGAYIHQIDQDRELQKMVADIVMMAGELGLETLAEGVETAGEQVVLTELGCGYLQGFGIARPMAPELIPAWIRAHQAGSHSGAARAQRVAARG